MKRKYKITEKVTPKELKTNYFCKTAIPEISKLAKTLHLSYSPLWKSILLSKQYVLTKNLINKERSKIFLSIEAELISLFIAKQNKSEFKDPDYESEFALLSLAIERAIGNSLKDIEDDLVFQQKSEELKKKYIYLYYKTACKYKLPTIRITPFILRLIT